MSSTVEQIILASLERIEGKLDNKAEKDDLIALEGRMRASEEKIARVYTLGSLFAFLISAVGLKAFFPWLRN